MKAKILLFGLTILLLSPMRVAADAIDDYLNSIVKDGKVYLNMIKPADDDEGEGLYAYAYDQFSNNSYSVWGICREPEPCYIDVQLKDGSEQRIQNVEVVYNEYDKNLASKINSYKSQFSDKIEEFIKLEDLDIINFIYNGGYDDGSNNDILNKAVNYSTDLKRILENGNIIATFDPRAGSGSSDFNSNIFGYLVLSHNNFAYAVAQKTGFALNKVLYVPDATAKNNDAFIAAAKLKLKSYLNEDIEITVAGSIADAVASYNAEAEAYCVETGFCTYTLEDYPPFEVGLENIINEENTTGDYYTFKINGVEHKFFIERSNSKMKAGVLNTKDVNSGSKIYANSASIPIDSHITYRSIAEKTTEYKNTLEKLKLSTGLMADISLLSNSNGSITKLEDGKFSVYIPISEAMQKQKIKAYYLNEDGTIEKYDAKVEDGYAVFETNHFSTYTLSGADILTNPQTFDNVGQYIILGTISLIGITGIGLYLGYKRVNI